MKIQMKAVWARSCAACERNEVGCGEHSCRASGEVLKRLGQDSLQRPSSYGKIMSMRTARIAARDPVELERAFSDLAERWRRRAFYPTEKNASSGLPANHRIGPSCHSAHSSRTPARAGPLVWVLNAISGDDPAPAGSSFGEAAEAWLKWGHERGSICF